MMNAGQSRPSLMIFYQFDPWRSSIGGIQTVIRNFLKYAPASFEVGMVGTGAPGDLLGQWQTRFYGTTPVQYCPIIALENDDVRGRIPTTLKYTAALRRYPMAADFFHFHRLEPSLVTRRWQGEKTWFVHNDVEKQLNPRLSPNAILWQMLPQAYLWLERWLVPQFDYLYSCNLSAAQFYRRRFPALAPRIHQIYNSVDTEIFYPLEGTQADQQRQALAQSLGLSSQTQFLLFAGRLHPQKDPLRLLQAMARLHRPQTHLLMAGEGELLAQVSDQIQILGLEAQVTLLGRVSQDRLAQLQRVSQIFVLSSAYEGLPIAALEALASGTPVVTTDAGDTPRLLTAACGRVCLDRSPEAIAQALQDVLDHSTTFSVAACLEAVQPYTARSVVAQVYQQMWDRWISRRTLGAREGSLKKGDQGAGR
ncbi:glycosyltransferase family 4 protein [Lyngbya confervoides]|uniref:Glycosyltransferase family 4 protein n=1 Tax=Lyngbya confervoides BDU141951 TaxID=1574623 RepID=A0ABD4T7E5_9CYAN|nr:glycosyltransferase family 4 protein [Lyngbya confervoides]MCM1984677.1 glycosyltransferase family 4 protein [Lyngbya confervoides BDU141951]